MANGEVMTRYLTTSVGYPANCSDLSTQITCNDGRLSTDLRMNTIPTTYVNCSQTNVGQAAIAFSQDAWIYSQTIPTTFISHSSSAIPESSQLAAGTITVENPACYSSICGFYIRKADYTYVGNVSTNNATLGAPWTGSITLPVGTYDIYTLDGSYSGTLMGRFSTY